jgi:hypothetical protein
MLNSSLNLIERKLIIYFFKAILQTGENFSLIWSFHVYIKCTNKVFNENMWKSDAIW